MRSSRSGSETRQRNNDVRVRLSEDEIEMLDAAVRQAGFSGQQARGNWIRAQLGLLPLQEPSATASHQRVPLPGGQALLASLGKIGTDLRKLTVFLGAYVTDKLAADDRSRLEIELLPWTDEVRAKLDRVIAEVAERFSEEGGGR
jgi:hypothetical protein